MTAVRLSCLIAVTFLWIPGAPAAVEASRTYGFHHDHVLGTSLDLLITIDSPKAAEAVESSVLKTIERLRAVLSHYDPNSQISRLNRAHGSLQVSEALIDVLDAARKWRQVTGGAFSVQVDPLVRLWKEAEARGGPPDPNKLTEVVRGIRQHRLVIDPVRRTVRRSGSGTINLDGLAKGYIIDRAFGEARAAFPNLRGLLIDIGGDLYGWRDQTTGDSAPWRIAILDPRSRRAPSAAAAVIGLRRGAVATSGPYARRRRVGGRSYSHIIDPRTGQPVQGILSATVLADDAMTADALATALNVLPVREGIGLIDSVDGAECLVIDSDEKTFQSRGWGRRVLAAPPRPQANPAASSWPKDHQLDITIKLARPRSRKYRRPYVVIWVTDADDKPVRTVSLWRRKSKRTKYLNSLKVWWRFGKKNLDRIDSFSRATRNPGEYTVTWDGTDDRGKPLGPGRYTVHVEVSREHGTHVHMEKSIACGTATPATQKLPGNKEVDWVKLKYGKEAP